MKNLNFIDCEEFACEVSEVFESLTDKFGEVSVVAKYDKVKEIIRELVSLGYSIESIDIHRPTFNKYTDEYILSLNFDGIWCVPMKCNGNYIYDKSSVIYILDNCSSACIPYCKAKEVYEVCIGDVDEKNDGCEDSDENTQISDSTSIHISRAKDGTPEGFSESRTIQGAGVTFYSSSSYYSNDLDLLRKAANSYGVKL